MPTQLTFDADRPGVTRPADPGSQEASDSNVIAGIQHAFLVENGFTVSLIVVLHGHTVDLRRHDASAYFTRSGKQEDFERLPRVELWTSQSTDETIRRGLLENGVPPITAGRVMILLGALRRAIHAVSTHKE